MTSNQILTADLLDILFENRNKDYGAYAIRKAYPKNLMKAVGLMLLVVIALCVFVMSQPKKPMYRIVPYVIKPDRTLENLKEKEKPKEPEPLQRHVPAQPATKPDFVPVIVDHVTKNPVPDRTDTATYVPGAVDKPAIGNDGGNYSKAEVGVVNITQETSKPTEPVILNFAEVQPEFPGGADAWLNYLRRMLRVPDELEPGDRKTVKVKFVVNSNGEIADAVIIQSAGNSFDKEVLRVIARMPKWKPGKQNGKPVAVYFMQLVTFTAAED